MNVLDIVHGEYGRFTAVEAGQNDSRGIDDVAICVHHGPEIAKGRVTSQLIQLLALRKQSRTAHSAANPLQPVAGNNQFEAFLAGILHKKMLVEAGDIQMEPVAIRGGRKSI